MFFTDFNRGGQDFFPVVHIYSFINLYTITPHPGLLIPLFRFVLVIGAIYLLLHSYESIIIVQKVEKYNLIYDLKPPFGEFWPQPNFG